MLGYCIVTVNMKFVVDWYFIRDVAPHNVVQRTSRPIGTFCMEVLPFNHSTVESSGVVLMVSFVSGETLLHGEVSHSVNGVLCVR